MKFAFSAPPLGVRTPRGVVYRPQAHTIGLWSSTELSRLRIPLAWSRDWGAVQKQRTIAEVLTTEEAIRKARRKPLG
jgi:hypothetical protein